MTSRTNPLRTSACFLAFCLITGTAFAHIVPPERLHPVAETYRRLVFMTQLNPVPWEAVRSDAVTLVSALDEIAPEVAAPASSAVSGLIAEALAAGKDLEPARRREIARAVLDASTSAVAAAFRHCLERAEGTLGDPSIAIRELEEARQVWAAFEPSIRAADPEGFRRLGEGWLDLASSLGSAGLLGVGTVRPDEDAFAAGATELVDYVEAQFHDASLAVAVSRGLPPGSNINKQLPRPRQILNMATRGVDESETALIALGDMAFDSALIFGEPARSLAITCNTCHNKSITNPGFFIPGLSARPGGMDVSNSFFAPHANNGHFDPLDIPDLRGIRFTSPYGRNGRFESLREFVRNVIVNEFNGPEPDPLLLDGIIAYMLEFDFLPNPVLRPDGTLEPDAPAAARRGQEVFHREFPQMGNRSCASCHVPSDHFLDRRSHDIGSAVGAEPASRDRALDTPTLLSSKYTAPYFHDGRLPTLGAVTEWFDEQFALALSEAEKRDLTSYLEAIGDGVDAYEDTVHTLEAEMEEFSFFLSTYEFLRQREKDDLIDTTFGTIAFEIRAHKWDVQDSAYLPVLDELARLMDEARAANGRGEFAAVDRLVAEYRTLYQENVDYLK